MEKNEKNTKNIVRGISYNQTFILFTYGEMDTLKLVYTQDEAFGLVDEYTEAYKKKIKQLEKENKKLKKYYDRDKEELMESCYGLARENDELKKENENLNEKVRFLEECLDRKEKLNEKYRKELKNYVYDAKQVRDIC